MNVINTGAELMPRYGGLSFTVAATFKSRRTQSKDCCGFIENVLIAGILANLKIMKLPMPGSSVIGRG